VQRVKAGIDRNQAQILGIARGSKSDLSCERYCNRQLRLAREKATRSWMTESKWNCYRLVERLRWRPGRSTSKTATMSLS
jgi:hypothetical protein